MTYPTERRSFTGNETDLTAWNTWLRLHGVTPEDVLLEGGWIARDEEKRQVQYLAVVRDAAGQPEVQRNSDGSLPPEGERFWFVEDRFVQLESKPMPFPAVSDA